MRVPLVARTPALRSSGLAILFAWISCSCGGEREYVLGRIVAGAEAGVGIGGAGAEDTDGGQPPSVPDALADSGTCDPGTPRAEYRFTGEGELLVEARGGPSATIHGGARLDGSGELVLDGNDDYVDLPNDLISGLDATTIVVWFRHLGGPAYTRLFDLGSGSHGEDPPEGLGTVGLTYLALTPGTGFVPRHLAALISQRGAGGEIAAVTDMRLDDSLHLVAVAVTSTTLELYHDGALMVRVPNSVPLANIETVNNWLGRSQYDQDPYLRGAYSGFAVFDRALGACAIRAVFADGPPR